MAVHREKITSFYLSTILITRGIERKTIFNDILPVNAVNFLRQKETKNHGLYEHFQRNNSIDRTQSSHKYIGLRERLLSFMSIYYYTINYPR